MTDAVFFYECAQRSGASSSLQHNAEIERCHAAKDGGGE